MYKRQPLGESKSDCEILTLLARRMKMDDELLCAGYEACIKYIIQDLPITCLLYTSRCV